MHKPWYSLVFEMYPMCCPPTHTPQDAFVALKEDVSISIAGGRNNLIQLMEAEKGTHVDIAQPLPVWVLDRSVAADAPESLDSASDVIVGLKRERSLSDNSPFCASADGDLIEPVGRENPLDRLKRADTLKAFYFVGLSLKDQCFVCRQGTPSPGAFFKCPIKGSSMTLKVLKNFNDELTLPLSILQIFWKRQAKQPTCPSKDRWQTGLASCATKLIAGTILRLRISASSSIEFGKSTCMKCPRRKDKHTCEGRTFQLPC